VLYNYNNNRFYFLSPELLQGCPWFYRNYVEYVTENVSCPYLLLEPEGWQAKILEKIEMLYAFYEAGRGDNAAGRFPCFKVIESFCSVMEILYGHLPAPRQVVNQEVSEITSLKNMVAYVEEHFTERLTLDGIAAAGACCKSQCSLLFKKYLRETPVSYITKFRLRRSLVPLLETDSSITEIAYQYGFGGASYYCETFRKYYGMSPLKYKKGRLKA